jgi:hypothetical protein
MFPLVVPLLAVQVLDATAGQVGALLFALTNRVPAAGHPVRHDRYDRRTLMLVGGAGRCVATGAVPVLWAFDRLTLPLLGALLATVGLLTVLFGSACRAFQPSIVAGPARARSNAWVQRTKAVAAFSVPALGGLITQTFGLARAVVIDPLSYAVSFVCIAPLKSPSIQARPPSAACGPESAASAPGRRSPSSSASWAGPTSPSPPWSPCRVLFLVQVVRVTPGMVGLLLAAEGVGAFVGSSLAVRLANQFGPGRTIGLPPPSLP